MEGKSGVDIVSLHDKAGNTINVNKIKLTNKSNVTKVEAI